MKVFLVRCRIFPDEGTMSIDEPAVCSARSAGCSPGGCRRMIYQELSLARHLSVMENILLGMEPTTGPFMRWNQVRAPCGGGDEGSEAGR